MYITIQLPDGYEDDFIYFRFYFDNHLREEILNYVKPAIL